MTRVLSVLAAVACLATAPAVARAQAPVQQTPAPAASQATHSSGPRLGAEFKSYHPKLAQEEESATASAAADKTTITISTLALVLLIVLLIVLIA